MSKSIRRINSSIAAVTLAISIGAAGNGAGATPNPSSTDAISYRGYVPTAKATACPRGVKLPRGIDPRACGPIPKGAKPIKTIHRSTYDGSKTAVIVSPSGINGCDLSARYSGCGSWGLIRKPIRVSESGDSFWWIEFGKGKTKFLPRGDAPYYDYNQPKPQVVPYGAAAYYGKYACLSAKTGLTCWDSKTGHGLMISSTKAITW